MKRKIKNKCYYVTAMFTREHAGWPRTIQNSCFVHLTAMERKTYIVLKLSFFRNNLRTEQGCLALARCQEMFHQLSQPKYSLFRTQFPSATTTRCTLLLLTRSHCSESAAGHKLCQHHYTWKGKLQKKKYWMNCYGSLCTFTNISKWPPWTNFYTETTIPKLCVWRTQHICPQNNRAILLN